jgi:hypothetical protein
LVHTAWISDLQYSVPTCTVNGNVLNNAFGSVTIGNNLLADGIEFTFHLDYTQHSCRLCDISNAYCDESFANESNLYPSQDTTYNFKLISLTDQNLTFSTVYVLEKGQKSLTVHNLIPYLSNQHDGILCGKAYRFVLFLTLHIESPINRDILTFIGQERNNTVSCSNYSMADLSCRLLQNYNYIDYTVENCVNSHSGGDGKVKQTRKAYSPLYWYKNRATWPPYTPLLCREDWSSLMDRIKPQYFACSRRLALYIKLMPWYEAALETMTAFFNNDGLDDDILSALDALEAHCHERDSGLLTLSESIFYNMTLAFRDRLSASSPTPPPPPPPPALSLEDECDSIPMSGDDEIELPYYVENHDGWEMTLFKYIIYFDYNMPWLSIILLSFIVLSSVAFIIIILATIVMSIIPCYRLGRMVATTTVKYERVD